MPVDGSPEYAASLPGLVAPSKKKALRALQLRSLAQIFVSFLRKQTANVWKRRCCLTPFHKWETLLSFSLQLLAQTSP